ncbi:MULTISPECIES: hypothetical protein [Acidiphilium]|uniref:Uncharacterized protein n=1 Tax=Acidiphilium rubrum TaxID=526 RepID=A0A8G2CHB0_ACIRU|nr:MULTISPECIES: hypothetical protein [Acidiphilium]SIQ03745.1 hypothetical protein SAMN05421828_10137 [Acidiphilium rubrum]
MSLSTRVRTGTFQPMMRVAIVLGIAIGLVQSLKLVFHLWGADSDVADPVLLWNGVHRYGLQFVTMWRYTQDNWLLSLMPFDAVMFALFGDRPVVVVATGLLFFWAIVLLVGVLIGRERGGWIGAGAAMVLLFAGEPTIGNGGFLGYPVSHGISLVWGLIGLLLTVSYLDRRRPILLAGAGVCLFVAAVSDPWADAAFMIPMLLAALSLIVIGRADRRPLIAIVAMLLVVGLLVQTRLFGALGFLPGVSHSVGTPSQMIENAAFAARYIAVFFNILPGLLTVSGQTPATPAVTIDCVIFFALVLLCLFRVIRNGSINTARCQFIAITALASMFVMLAALIVTGFQQGMVTARYLSNIFVFVPLLIAASPAGSGPNARFDRGALLVLAGLFITSGLVSDRVVWNNRTPTRALNGIPQMAAFLAARHITFGYGPYWWTQANATGWVTHGKLTIRPIDFNPSEGKFVPKPVQTLPNWYTKPAIAREPSRMALILSPSPGDCGAATTCLAAATAQFGPPAQIVPYGPLTVLIYNHHLYLAPR